MKTYSKTVQSNGKTDVEIVTNGKDNGQLLVKEQIIGWH